MLDVKRSYKFNSCIQYMLLFASDGIRVQIEASERKSIIVHHFRRNDA